MFLDVTADKIRPLITDSDCPLMMENGGQAHKGREKLGRDGTEWCVPSPQQQARRMGRVLGRGRDAGCPPLATRYEEDQFSSSTLPTLIERENFFLKKIFILTNSCYKFIK